MRRQLILFGTGLAVAALLSVGLIFTLSMIRDFDLPPDKVKTVEFRRGDDKLEGTLITSSTDGPVVLLVHGDGPQDRWSRRGYLPLVNTLVEAGISVFSWDKPGVGVSDGNWLDQSMQDRAAETVSALSAVRQLPGFKRRKIGLLGFSQAGWVLPRVPTLADDASFLILIGGAINWQEQGRYYGTRRLELEGKRQEEIEANLDRQEKRNRIWLDDNLTYSTYVTAERAAGVTEAQLMSKDRFIFTRLNFREDARGAIPRLTLPVLILSGAEDLNVDSLRTVSVYASLLLDTHPLNQIRLVPAATHSLLRVAHYSYQLPEQWPLWAQARFLLSGRNAYATDVLKEVTDWIISATDNSS